MQKVSTHTEHDSVSDDEVNSTPQDGKAEGDVRNTPTCHITHSKSKGQNLTAKGFPSCLRV